MSFLDLRGGEMLTKDYYFDLPEELIAQEPAEKRGEDRLLFIDKYTGDFSDFLISDFPSLLRTDSVIVVNNSKVRKARVYGVSETGGTVEFLFLGKEDDGAWRCMVTKTKKQRKGKRYTFLLKDGGISGVNGMVERENSDGTRSISLDHDIDEAFFAQCGHVPLPPYIKREDNWNDESRYQTVYAKNLGSVASPTAGLHFTLPLMEKVRSMGIPIYEVTLHVGAGTFLPVRTENIEDHHMHTEHYEIDAETADALNKAKSDGKRIVAIGTTSVRTLESAADERGKLCNLSGNTDIFIHPGYTFRFVDDLLTNFHTPESTLLMLVSALAGRENILRAYRHAVDERYRFFSYGDACFIRG